jgi:hypothetical protein
VSVRADSGNSSKLAPVFREIEAKVTRETLLYLDRRVVSQEVGTSLGSKFTYDELFRQSSDKHANAFGVPDGSLPDRECAHCNCDG